MTGQSDQSAEDLARDHELAFYRTYYPRAHALCRQMANLLNSSEVIPAPPSQTAATAEFQDMLHTLNQVGQIVKRYQVDVPF